MAVYILLSLVSKSFLFTFFANFYFISIITEIVFIGYQVQKYGSSVQ